MWDRVRSGNIKSKYNIISTSDQDSKMSKLVHWCSVGSEMRVGDVVTIPRRRQNQSYFNQK